MERRANLSALTPTSGSPVTGEGHLPLPEAEGHHGLEEGELTSPPSSPHPPLPPCKDQGPLLLTLTGPLPLFRLIHSLFAPLVL